jgi:hypothetical protein
MRYPAAVFLLLFLAIPAISAEIDGKWTATVNGMDGNPMELTYNFKADGAKLTGTVTSPTGVMQITEGKIEGSSLSFTATSDQFSIPTKGTISGDEIKLSSEVGGQSIPILLKRVK